jgi:hypothetical protein
MVHSWGLLSNVCCSVVDQWHFDADPDPRILTSHLSIRIRFRLRIRIQLLIRLLSSLILRMQKKNLIIFIFFLITYPQAHHVQSNLVLKCFSAGIISVRSHIYEKREGSGAGSGSVPLTNGSGFGSGRPNRSCGSGSPTLLWTVPLHGCSLGWSGTVQYFSEIVDNSS